MPEVTPQELLKKICAAIVSVESLHENMSQIDNLPRREWNEFLNWYGEAMDFLKEQLDLFYLRLKHLLFRKDVLLRKVICTKITYKNVVSFHARTR